MATFESSATQNAFTFALPDHGDSSRRIALLGWDVARVNLFGVDESRSPVVLRPKLALAKGTPIANSPYPTALPVELRRTRMLPPPIIRDKRMAKAVLDFHQSGSFRPVDEPRLRMTAFRSFAKSRGVLDFTEEIEDWMLILGDAVSPSHVKSQAPDAASDWSYENPLVQAWARKNGYDTRQMESEAEECLSRYQLGNKPREHQMGLLAFIRFVLVFPNDVRFWLNDFQVSPPLAPDEIESSRILLSQRPELIWLSPGEAEKSLELSPDPRHRTLKDYCEALGKRFDQLSNSDLPALREIGKARRKIQSTGVAKSNKLRGYRERHDGQG